MGTISEARPASTSLIDALLEEPVNLSTAAKYSAMNGLIYLALGVLLIVRPGVTLALFMDRALVGDKQGVIRVVGLTVVLIGWLYLFGGRSGARQFVAASVVDRLVFVPIVLVPLATAGVFPHLLLAFTFSIGRSPSVHGCFSVKRRDSRSVAILLRHFFRTSRDVRVECA
jgi:cytochrome c biogenesis protein CcdA